MPQDSSRIETSLVINAPLRVANCNNFTALIMEEASSNAARITKPLDSNTGPFEGHTNTVSSTPGHKKHTGRSRLVTTLAPTNRKRLTSYHSRNRETLVHRIGIHNPG